MDAQRVERIVIHSTHEFYKKLTNFCFESKNLYNYANYILRQKYQEKDWQLFGKYDLRDYIRSIKDVEGNPLNRQYNAHAGYDTISMLLVNWHSYFGAVKSYNKNPEKFKARPKIPGYLPKDGKFVVRTDRAYVKAGYIQFSKCLKGFMIPFSKSEEIQCVRFVPHYNNIVVEIVYKIELPEVKEDNGVYLSIDIGIDNFATITSNKVGFQPVVLNGKGLKSINQYYNKQRAHYQGIAERLGQGKKTDRLQSMNEKRNRRVDDFLHKASRYIVNLALQNNVSKVVIGYNAGWKNEVNLGDFVNQKFVGIPYLKFIQKLRYKLENVGIELVITEEAYTSKTSFLDGEFPKKHKEYVGKRQYRGLFISAEGIKINADVNGSYQILKKVFPKAYVDGIRDVRVHPILVNVSDLRKGRKTLVTLNCIVV